MWYWIFPNRRPPEIDVEVVQSITITTDDYVSYKQQLLMLIGIMHYDTYRYAIFEMNFNAIYKGILRLMW